MALVKVGWLCLRTITKPLSKKLGAKCEMFVATLKAVDWESAALTATDEMPDQSFRENLDMGFDVVSGLCGKLTTSMPSPDRP